VIGSLKSFVGFSDHNAATLNHQSCSRLTGTTAAAAIVAHHKSSILAAKISVFCYQAIKIFLPFFIATTGSLSRPAPGSDIFGNIILLNILTQCTANPYGEDRSGACCRIGKR
jgi:hypothetical protein